MFPRILTVAAALLLTASLADAGQARQRWPGSSSQPSQGGGEAAPRTATPRTAAPRGEAPRESAPPPPRAAAPARAPAPAPARRTAAPRTAEPAPAPARATAPAEPTPPSSIRSRATAPAPGRRTAQPRQRFPREDSPATGVAVPRGSVAPPPQPSRPTTVYVPRVYNNYYYYPRRYYPYGYGSFGLGYFYYDPYTWYPYDNYNYRFSGYGYGYPTGEVRLQVRPRHAEVYVDGYYAGRVDEFDGFVQALRLEQGPYTIELVAPGYEPLIFNVRIQPGRKITYRGDLRPLRP